MARLIIARRAVFLPRLLLLARLLLTLILAGLMLAARLIFAARLALFLHRRRYGRRAGLDRIHAGNLVVEFAAGRTAVTLLAVTAATATVAAFAAATTTIIATRTGFLAHFDVHHLAAIQLLAGDLLDGVDILVVAVRGQHIGLAAAPRPAGAADAVDIVVGMDR